MIDVAKKKPPPVTAPPAELEPSSFVLRLPDKRLADALDAISEDDRRSRNNTIVIALEQFATSRGKWPPPSK